MEATGGFPATGLDFEWLYLFQRINNKDETVFIADPKDGGTFNTVVATHNGFRTYNQASVPSAFIKPDIADNGTVVFRDPISTITLNDFQLNPIAVIASNSLGFSSVGLATNISDDGKVVAFYGDLDNPAASPATEGLETGKGIFVSVETSSGRKIQRLAGIAGNGILDPGESHNDINENGNVDLGEDEGLIGGFNFDEPIGVSFTETDNGGIGTVAFLASDENGSESLISSKYSISNSSETIQTTVSTNLVAKVGEPANEVSSNLTGNIQDLSIYDPINEPGQIAFWTKTTNREEAVVRANPVRKPILLVPGIGATFPKDNFKEWLTNRGVEPDTLSADPVSGSWKDLIETLKRAGYKEGVDLFVATTDWRLNPGPIENTSPDGIIERSVGKLIDDTYEYSVDQFAFWLKEAITGWKSQFSDLPESEIPELDSVDVIAHSAGGLPVRTYIQSTAYGSPFNLDGETVKLPKVNNLITLGVPYLGASQSWNPLQNDFDGGFNRALGAIIKDAYYKVKKGETIKLSGKSYIDEAITQTEAENLSLEEFIELYVPNLRSLLATYPFISTDSGQNFNKRIEDIEPDQVNKFLLDLNHGYHDSQKNLGISDNSPDPTAFVNKINELNVVYGTGTDARDAVIKKDNPNYETYVIADPSNSELPPTSFEIPEKTILSFENSPFFTRPPIPGEIWYEEKTGEIEDADGTVVLESAKGIFDKFPKDKVIAQPFPGVGHGDLPYNKDIQKFILERLGINLKEEFISQSLRPTFNVDLLNGSSLLHSIIFDPVEGFLVDGQGRRLGYTNAIGAVTEIPGSFWLGETDGIGFISDLVEGPLQLELTGLGEDYYVSVAMETEDGSAGIESEGFLAAGEQLTLDIPVNNVPILDLNGDEEGIDSTASISENGGTFVIIDSNLTISDSESQNMAGATVTIQNPEDGNFELLDATATGNITVSYDTETSTLTLAGTDTIANYQQVLRSVTYTNNATNPNTTPRAISFVVDDGSSFNNLSPAAITTLSLPDGSGGQEVFTIAKGSGTTTISNFGGVGEGTNPTSEILSEVDTLKFEGTGLVASKLLLTQSGDDLVLNFGGINNTQVILSNFALKDLDNLPNQIGNILFDGQTTIQNKIDIFDSQENQDRVLSANKVTFLDDLDNSVDGLDNSVDIINGQKGNDSLRGNSGNDILRGEDGNDTLKGGIGNDRLYGQNQADNLVGNDGNDTLNGGFGYDRLSEFGNVDYKLTNTTLTGLGTDKLVDIETAYIAGGNSNNTIDAGDATTIKVTLDGGNGNDSMVAGTRSDVLFGKDGNDTLKGNVGNDQLFGQNQADNLVGGDGDDTLNGGGGYDRITEFGNVDYKLTNTTLTGKGTDTISNVETAYLAGGADDNTIDAGDATTIKVTLDGATGNDSMVAGTRSDVLFGKDGNDTLKGNIGNDAIFGQNQADNLVGGEGDDTLNGGGGYDRITEFGNVDYKLTNTALTGLGTDKLVGIETAYIAGGGGNNTIDAGDATEIKVTLDGAGGNDSIVAGTRSDVLYGQSGNDTLKGNAGNDRLLGQNGNDRFFGGEGNDTLDGGVGYDRLFETADVDLTLTNTQLTRVGTDIVRNIELARLAGGGGNNTLDASSSTEIRTVLFADAGNDTLMGSQIGDTLYGGAGSDKLDGNGGNDKLVGNSGADIFVLDAAMGTDTILDFQNGVDKLELPASIGFSDLSITSNTNGAGVSITDTTNNNELLAIVNGVSASGLDSDDFVSAAI